MQHICIRQLIKEYDLDYIKYVINRIFKCAAIILNLNC